MKKVKNAKYIVFYRKNKNRRNIAYFDNIKMALFYLSEYTQKMQKHLYIYDIINSETIDLNHILVKRFKSEIGLITFAGPISLNAYGNLTLKDALKDAKDISIKKICKSKDVLEWETLNKFNNRISNTIIPLVSESSYIREMNKKIEGNIKVQEQNIPLMEWRGRNDGFVQIGVNKK